MRKSLYDYCTENQMEEILGQWDYSKNEKLTPELITFGSRQKIWWKCRDGHEWKAAVYSRTGSGSGCPACAGRVVVSDKNSLACVYPDIAKQWHSEKNGELKPSDVMPASHKSVWWVCDKGHEWRTAVKARTSGSECPVCTNRKLCPGENDFGTTHPELAAQWHPTKNERLTPADVFAGSGRKVWWVCGKGHEWQSRINARATAGSSCPVCAGKVTVAGENDLASAYPELAAQWHPTKNGTLTAQMVTPLSNRRIWWVCEHGHEWQCEVAHRVAANSGCPYCAGRRVMPGFNDLATREPKIAAQWHPKLNGALTPQMVTSGSSKKVWWQCAEGHVWCAVVYSRTGPKRTGCPVCAGRVNRRRTQRYAEIMQQAPPQPQTVSMKNERRHEIFASANGEASRSSEKSIGNKT